MIHECTDCKHCADFHDGYRVVCLHPELPANAVIDYHPVGDGDAQRCVEFNDDEDPHYFTSGQLAEGLSTDKGYEGTREWCLKQLKERKA